MGRPRRRDVLFTVPVRFRHGNKWPASYPEGCESWMTAPNHGIAQVSIVRLAHPRVLAAALFE
jgi:hypothetical protein